MTHFLYVEKMISTSSGTGQGFVHSSSTSGSTTTADYSKGAASQQTSCKLSQDTLYAGVNQWSLPKPGVDI